MDRSPLPLTSVHWVSLALQSSVMGRHSMSQRIENTVSRFWFRMKISPPSLQALGRPSVFPFFYFQKFNNTVFFKCLQFFFFSWRIIALQCCAGFCVKQGGSVIIMCICPHPSRSARSSRQLLMFYSGFHELSVSHIIVYKCQRYFLSSSHPLLPQLCPQVWHPSLQIGSSVLFF